MAFTAAAFHFDLCRPGSRFPPLPLKVKAKGKWAHGTEKNFAAENDPACERWRP